MNFYYVLQICLSFLLLITITAGRVLRYDESDEENNSDLVLIEAESKGKRKRSSSPLSKRSSFFLANDDDNAKPADAAYESSDNSDIDTYEERKFHERSIFSTLRPPHFISARTREALIDFLQKAVEKKWRPNLKHYNPSTRFGRHRR
jgi:hypothetical protein